MKLIIKKHIGQAIGVKAFVPFGIKVESWSWREGVDIELRGRPMREVDAIEAVLIKRQDIQGVKVLLRDIATWRAALKDASTQKPRTVRQFEPLLQRYLAPLPNHWVFERSDETADDVWLPFYVCGIEYVPESRDRHDYTPAHVFVSLASERFDLQKVRVVTFYDEDLRGKTVVEALAAKGFYAETPDLIKRHQQEMARYSQIHDTIGRQFYCTGFGYDDPDGNTESRRDSWYWKRTHALEMGAGDEQARVVMDVFFEDRDEDRTRRQNRIDTFLWKRIASVRQVVDADGDATETVFDDDDGMDGQADIPIHPFLVVFDLKRHLRLRVHVHQLTDYVYDKQLADKLVLSDDRKALVKMLIDMRSGAFRDIVKGKSGGAVVLLAGPPGTGKTLTAEVYAEAEGRALYSVQCSQLGTNPEELETELLKTFARAKRWNAVMLLDEADVYVHERGNDMQQNAIVGVFLRVLEYQDSILFLTTNRPNDVDDAIASRCIARLTYDVPNAEDQKRIWRVLSDGCGAIIDDTTIDAIVDRNRNLSGRDVKNLLKLGRLVMPTGITADAIEFVKQFKPTSSKDVGLTMTSATIGRCPDCGMLVGRKQHVCPKRQPATV